MTKAVNFSWSFALENCITLCKAKLNGLRSIGRKTAFAEKLKNATDNNNSPTNCMECIMKYTLLIIKRMIGRVFGFGIFNFNGQFFAVLLFPLAILLSRTSYSANCETVSNSSFLRSSFIAERERYGCIMVFYELTLHRDEMILIAAGVYNSHECETIPQSISTDSFY